MKLLVKNGIAQLANSPLVWPLFKTLRKAERGLDAFCTYAERQRRAGARKDLKTTILAKSFSDLTVKNGHFAGLKYPDAAATGSALLPKLIGSYENELDDFLAVVRQRTYSDILDIGCAEGFYAAGLARLFPTAMVHAFDVDDAARAMCQRTAEVNNVADRMQLDGFCDPERLRTLDLRGRALIFADCEGYEAELFSSETAPALAMHDLIIECHDYKDSSISPGIIEAFSASHDISMARSVSNRVKAEASNLPQLTGYNEETRRFIVDEARHPAQFWLFLSSKEANEVSRKTVDDDAEISLS